MVAVGDRRAVRSRAAIRASFVGLVLEKGFRSVTIDEILARAEIARGTFYAHYRDKDDLLLSIAREVAADREQLMPAIEDAQPQGFSGLPVLRIFEHAEQERATYQVILRGEGDGAALRELTDAVARKAEETFTERARRFGAAPRIPLDVMARAWAGEIVGVLTWWVEGGSNQTAAEITRQLRDLSVYGRAWASGLSSRDFSPESSAI
ncbi:TetR/AcrR family transcriptional regulator [Arthrobacter sp. M4]|uniref:TetR/AcrR family transcriptional regulator n=1 Tax=Arthrobacter sp. M4 TaxID=218160 RepID=UPI001CDD0145|nr:TetR/AcrR family transcriptional regulator [Arthrobacter sp. M4]MCA4135287.1 TetR/AcrR family transcriptional regulator [Arthrobacter sp. M4]